MDQRSQSPVDYAVAAVDNTSMLLNRDTMAALTAFGEMMSKSSVTVPKHLQGKSADCTAIAMQAAQWNMNPFAVAQKTHMSQGGTLGYEAQLVNAVIVNSGALSDRPEYEFLGDWSRILGQVEERSGNSGGKYYVAAWKKADEDGLGVVVSATIHGEDRPRSITVMLSQAYPRFSTQWATDPQQQICYLALRKFARRYVPDAILGVYTDDELQEPAERYMGPVDEKPQPKTAGPRRRSETPAPAPKDQGHAEAPAATTVIDAETGEVVQAAVEQTRSKPAPEKEKESPATAGALTGGQVAYLRNKLKAAGASEDSICKRFEVESLDGLSVEQFDELKVELLRMA